MTAPNIRIRLRRAAHELRHRWPEGPDHLAHELLEMIETGSDTTLALAATMGCRERDIEPLLIAMQRRGRIAFTGTRWHSPDALCAAG